MAASMVNIADFRCRDLRTHMGQSTARNIENRGALRVVEFGQAVQEQEPDSVGENPGVVDISAAQDNAHMRQRVVLQAAPTSRHRSNLVRFNEPQVAVMKINQPHATENWAQDDHDHPPAA